MRWGFLPLAAVVISAPASAQSPEQAAVEAAMAASAAGWNSGSVDRFMAIYSDAPETSFVTANGLVRGKAAIAERYRQHYNFDDPAKRGTLSFRTLDFRLLDPTHALYVAQYLLTYPDGKTATGPTSLVLRKEKTGWKIIADHSS
jgi:uncharacterized protein (TIGR02246 family)